MAEAIFYFPRGFMWGTATASYQVEGNNTNTNWYAWEKEGHIIQGHQAGLACDWWGGRWREDFDRAADGGQNAHRLSIEWSRVQPVPDHWDEEALDRYREMIRSLRERNLTPVVTLQHFTEPLWLTKKGSWENDEIVGHFIIYVKKVVEALHEYVNTWVTINEPNGLAFNGYLLGDFPPGKRDFGSVFQVLVNIVRAHAGAYHAIHQIQPEAKVGMSHYYRGLGPANPRSPLDRWITEVLSQNFNNQVPNALKSGVVRFLARSKRIPEAKDTQDYLGIDYYTTDWVSFDLRRPRDLFSRRFFPPQAELCDTSFLANVPAGMFQAIKWGLQFKLPIIITENGVADASDGLRRRYLAEHIHQVWRAVNFNWPVKGYFHWTLVDNFEWERGWTQRFGLWELDTESQARHKRPSADFYAEICRANGLSSEMVARYAPEIFEKMFPG
ncbi:MAG: family 1 glycosylhydrolase [Anaerolineales bacterium]